MKDKENMGRKSRKAKTDKEKADNPPVKKPGRVCLKSIRDVKKLLSITINELRRGEVDAAVAGKIFYGLTVMLTIFEQFDLVGQIEELERRVNGDG
jgi:hypothetical protein